MKIIDLQGGQGSEAWLAFRAGRFGSSEAAAMLGLSEHCTRSELLRIKHTGLEREFHDWVRRNVLDKGHAVEAATRPMIEAQIDDTLYPVTCQGEGRLAASCDGLTMDGALAWECKQWNERLAVEVASGRVPDTHMPQCQHILLVTGADRLLFTVSNGTGEHLVSTEVLPSADWFQRLQNGWSRFEQDLAAYTLPAAIAPTSVGKAPDSLPALRIEVTGMVTASNLAEFKETALAAIRSVNRDLSTDADFADAEKAVKWCADVESRLAGAKEHALSQTSSIDQLFKAIDDISAEARRVRLDLDKLVVRRKMEVKEEAVTAARSALDLHIAAVNSEIAPMRLLPLAVDFAGAIKGKRSIDSMRDALDTALAGAKIAADAQGRAIRTNITLLMDDAHGLEFLFADLGQIVHKAADDFATLVHARVDTHQAAEAERQRKAAEAEAQRIAAAEQRAREQEAARITEAQRQQDAAAEAQRQATAALATASATPALQATAAAPPPVSPVVVSMPATTVRASAPATAAPATLNLGAINVRFGGCVKFDAAGLALMGIEHSATDKSARLYRESDIGRICRALVALAVEVQEAQAVAA